MAGRCLGKDLDREGILSASRVWMVERAARPLLPESIGEEGADIVGGND